MEANLARCSRTRLGHSNFSTADHRAPRWACSGLPLPDLTRVGWCFASSHSIPPVGAALCRCPLASSTTGLVSFVKVFTMSADRSPEAYFCRPRCEPNGSRTVIRARRKRPTGTKAVDEVYWSWDGIGRTYPWTRSGWLPRGSAAGQGRWIRSGRRRVDRILVRNVSSNETGDA